MTLLLPFLIFAIYGLFFLLVIILLIYLIVKRFDEHEKENFEKRDH